jgi:hypothetical protein
MGNTIVQEEPVYFISSATDWHPIKMKTKRDLAIEKIAM